MADVSVDPECKDPKELFGQGVRAYVLQDYEVAVNTLSKVSELLVAEHKDDMHESLGEVYLYYGKALLGLSRDQNEALGDAVPKNSAEDSEEEEEEKDEGIETEESEENKTEGNSASSSVNGEANKASKEKPKESDDQAEPCPPTGSGDDPGPSSSKQITESTETTEEQQNGEEDASDLQLAWEVLELAKKIFQKLDDKKSLAETLIILGEVSLESENFQSAINDIKQGLDVQKELFSQDSRAVAETLYKLGMAYSTNSQIDEAIDSFNSSLDYLRNRIKTLEEMKTMSQENTDEVEEIKALIPDIEDKIADMRVYKEEAIKKISEALTEPTKASQDGAAAGSSKRATDISHLVKRKRKLDEEEKPISEEIPAKKPAV